MNAKQLLTVIGEAQDDYITAAVETWEGVSHRKHLSLKRPLLIAAIIALMLMLVGCTVAYVNSWFTDYFAKQSDEPLSSEQLAYIEQNEQVIAETQTQNNCTIELKSAMTDGEVAYIILRVTAPEEIALRDACIGNWGYDVLQPVEGTLVGSGLTMPPLEDDDGLDNTIDIVLMADAAFEDQTLKPFGEDIKWKLHIVDLVAYGENKAYLEELSKREDGHMLNGGEGLVLNEEEMRIAYPELTLAEGVWDYELTFTSSDLREIEMVEEPVAAKHWRTRDENGDYLWEDTMITSVRIRSLSITIDKDPSYGHLGERYVVMKDGSRIALGGAVSTARGMIHFAEEPIVLEEVAYVQFGDGTKLPMP